jgi:hypothetical protein
VSGLNQQFAKLPYWKRYRGFESPPHRNNIPGYGAVRLARLLWEQEVVGSNPTTPTL